jgi:hypothetical protein
MTTTTLMEKEKVWRLFLFHRRASSQKAINIIPTAAISATIVTAAVVLAAAHFSMLARRLLSLRLAPGTPVWSGLAAQPELLPQDFKTIRQDRKPLPRRLQLLL